MTDTVQGGPTEGPQDKETPLFKTTSENTKNPGGTVGPPENNLPQDSWKKSQGRG